MGIESTGEDPIDQGFKRVASNGSSTDPMPYIAHGKESAFKALKTIINLKLEKEEVTFGDEYIRHNKV